MANYKSYCWSLGTTSFRMVEFNKKIEEQLELLNKFWDKPKYDNQKWSSNNTLQIEYYNFIKEQNFIENKDAARKDKDAREKTSGLVDLGLIDEERRITPVGYVLLDLSQKGNFHDDNIMQIPADSFIYFKQLLKLSYKIDNGYVRPYIILAYLLCELKYLTKDEFTYLLPLITNKSKLNNILLSINEIRNGQKSIDDCILSILLEMDNYKKAKDMFLRYPVCENLIFEIGMNRKSRNYDKPYLCLYQSLLKYTKEPNDKNVISILDSVDAISGRAKTYWKQYIFNTSLTSKIKKDGVLSLNNVKLLNCKEDKAFKEEFFNKLHLFKAKSLLDDYYDLNKRYFKTSKTILFQDNKIKFDIIPNCYFLLVKEELLKIAFIASYDLKNNISLNEFGKAFDINQQQIFKKVEDVYGVKVRNLYDVKNFVDTERYDRFNKMLDDKFSDEVLIDLMDKFENREDSDIMNVVTNNADIPTIFEYIIAIIWYKISGRHGKILDYMNLSLDADLLPITHASGGHEDITYHYDKTLDYPEHTLLIEATLANKTNQRRMEMEPVSRHLGEHILKNLNEEAYCLFTTTFLHVNVISDFRIRKNMLYYSNDSSNHINGMKIIPFQTSEIKTILKNNITYGQLYKIFENAYQADVFPDVWYEKEIVDKIKES